MVRSTLADRVQWLGVVGVSMAAASLALWASFKQIGLLMAILAGLFFVLVEATKRQLRMQLFFYLTLWAVVLSPSVHVVSGVPAIRAEEAILACFVLVVLIGKKRVSVYPSPPGSLSLFLFFCAVIASIFLSSNPVSKDVMELVKIGKYFLLLWIGYNADGQEENTVKYVRALFWASCISSLVAIAQYYDFVGVNSWLSGIYTDTQLETLIRYHRVIGTTANPNEFCLVLAFPIGVAYSLTIQKHFRFTRMWWAAIGTLILCLVAFAMTGSRTGVIALAVMFLVLTLRRNGSILQKSLIGSVIALVAFSLFYVGSDYWLLRMSALSNPLTNESFLGRVYKWRSHIADILSAPFFGNGPNKANGYVSLDSEWILLLYRYGAVGLGLFIAWIGTLGFRLGFFRRTLERPFNNALREGVFAALIAAFVFMLTASFFLDLQVMSLFAVLAGVALAPDNRKSESLPVGEGL